MMKEDIKKRLLATVVTVLMLTSGLAIVANNIRGATVTNNNAPEVLVLPGTTDVLVANFTLDGTIDVTIAGTKPDTGTTLITNNPWSDVYFYDDGDGVWENTKDAIWEDDGNFYYDVGKDPHVLGLSTENVGPGSTGSNPWSNVYTNDGGTSGGTFEDTADTIVVDVNTNTQYDQGTDLYIGVEPSNGEDLSGWGTSNPWSNVYTNDGGTSGGTFEDTADTIWVDDGEVYYDVGIDTHIAGVNAENTGRGTTTNPWATAEQPVVFYDKTSGDSWSEDDDWIGLDGYIKEIRVENTGTATQDEIDNLFLWIDDGDKKFEPADGDIPKLLSPSATDDKVWEQTLSPNLEIDGTQVYFISADISWIDTDFSVKKNTIKMKVEVDVVNSPSATFSFTNEYTQKIALLGVTYFEGNQDGPADVIATDTKDIEYGETVTLKINTSNMEPGIYYLYYPHYKKTGSGGEYNYELKWLPYYYKDGPQPSVTVDESGGIKEMTAPVYFNISGLWVLDNDANAEDLNNPGGGDGNFAFFWVNGTEAYSIDISKTEVTYGKNESVKVTITEDDSTPSGVWVDIRRESDEYTTPVLRKYTTNGTVIFTVDTDRFIAGNYTIFVYRDNETAGGVINNYDEDDGTGHSAGYTEWYGIAHPDLTGDVSHYGPGTGTFDPPEKVSAVKKIVVKTGEPTLEIPEVNRTMHWSFPGEVKIYTKGYDGENLTFSSSDVKVYNSKGDDVTSHLAINADTGVIKIYSDSWGKDGTVWGKNGTWKVVIAKDTNDDGTEEWNGSVTFTVTSAPKVQIKILNPEDKEIREVPCDPDNPFFDLRFSVINKNHESLGGYGTEEEKEKAEKNITIYGDALFIGEEGKTLAEYEKICPCLLYTSPSPRDRTRSRMPSSA